jgi:hypothetical protein
MLAPNCCIVEKYTVPCSLFLSCDKHAKLDKLLVFHLVNLSIRVSSKVSIASLKIRLPSKSKDPSMYSKCMNKIYAGSLPFLASYLAKWVSYYFLCHLLPPPIYIFRDEKENVHRK